MSKPVPLFASGPINFETFQADYWRSKACYLGRVDLRHLSPLTFADLAELATQPEVESRQLTPTSKGYSVEIGPFDEPFTPEPGQMLMVQNVESFSYELSCWLSEQFGFLPRWRIEDVMATLASSGGSCGAHFDQYDVFLVQLAGTKTWQFDQGGHQPGDLILDSDVRLLKNFVAENELTQVTGDVLYIPPGVGHHGVANDDCVTLSIGIRNPLLNEMAAHLADRLLDQADNSSSLSDHFSGQLISSVEVSDLSEKLLARFSDKELLSDWYGSYMTEPRDPELLMPTPEFDHAEVAEWRSRQEQLDLDLPARIAIQTGRLFINGEAFPLLRRIDWLETLQQQRTVPIDVIPEADNDILQTLINASAVII